MLRFPRCTSQRPDKAVRYQSEDRPYSSQLSLLEREVYVKVQYVKRFAKCMAAAALPQKAP